MLISEDDELIPISALQHVVFCERRAALVHVERVWMDNGYTARGQVVHARVNTPGADTRRGVRVDRTLPLRSKRLGLFGFADCVEWVAVDGREVPRPVETKSGRYKPKLEYQVQLCAQGLCLEEVVGRSIESGALFFSTPHRRIEVPFTAELRARTEQAAARMHELVRRGNLPPPEPGSKCSKCSLESLCLPSRLEEHAQSLRYMEALFRGD